MIKGEGLNILIGSVPSETVDEKCSEKIKLAIMEYLNREYGMTEADFLSAELCCVPAFNACDIGFDRSFVGAYGHDDRVCSYPAATSLFDLTETPAHTGVCLDVYKRQLIYDKNVSMQVARNRLGSFQFIGETQLKTVDMLSGGEKSRLRLCELCLLYTSRCV